VNEAEVYVSASNTADNGIKYGVDIELNADAADGSAADEAYAYLDSDQWGRLELGDQDDATNRMSLGSQNAHKGLGGPTGGWVPT
jgi:outer membrane protein OmpU